MPTTPPSPGYHWEFQPAVGRLAAGWHEVRNAASVGPGALGLPGGGATKLEAKVHQDLAYPMVVLSALGGAAAGHILGKTVDSPKLGSVIGGLIAGLYVLTATKA